MAPGLTGCASFITLRIPMSYRVRFLLLFAAACVAFPERSPAPVVFRPSGKVKYRAPGEEEIIGNANELFAQAEAAAVASIGQPRFDAEVDAGRGLSREAALGLALGVAVGTPVSADGQAGPLGKREADVARLVAEGLSNKQIGSRLFISERTVDSHVRSILNKLGFNSRAQIAGWIASSKA